MNNKLPYEQKIEDQLLDIPLPDENAAWEDMRKRLEDDGDGIIPFWLRGCSLWGLIGIIILAVSWWVIRPEEWWNKKQETETIKNISKEKNSKDKNTKLQDTLYTVNKKPSTNRNAIIESKNETGPETLSSKNSNPEEQKILKKKKEKISSQITDGGKTNKQTNKVAAVHQQPVKNVVKKNKSGNDQDTQVIENKKPVTTLQEKISSDSTGINNKPHDMIKDSVPMKNDVLQNKDSVGKSATDSIKKKKKEKIIAPEEEKEDSTESDKIFFSAGIGLQQQIPIEGQKLVPYSSLGRNNLLSDYVPSVYFQANNPNRWFANIGFRYGAPQYNKEFTYSQDIVYDSSSQSNITTSLNLKKSFYHQLPVSFNYYILPNWSAGAGFIWNKFYGAVADKEVSKSTGQTDTVLSKEIIAFRSDSTSSFSKSYFQILLQTEYNWKRFYFGIRYTFGMQPYIHFTLANGAEEQERNRWLQLFIRYDLWRSKMK